MNVVESLPILSNVFSRLKALASATGIPDDVMEHMQIEIEAIKCAIETLRHDIDHLVIIIGHSDLIKPIVDNAKDQFDITTIDVASESGKRIVAMAIEPSEEFIKKCREAYNPDSWQGNSLKPEQVPDNMYCTRYFAVKSDKDEKKRAILFEVDVMNRWSAVEIATWAEGVFNHVKWQN